jgi:hypothetical protein
MKLQEIFDQLVYGELNQLAGNLGVSNIGTVSTDNYPKVVAGIRMGLTELYKRFRLSSDVVTIVMIPEVTMYKLHSMYSMRSTDVSVRYKYIDDSAYFPFTDSVLSIDRVFDEVNDELPLNNQEAFYSLYTPQMTTIQIPDPVEGSIVNVHYTKNHDFIIGSPDINPLSVEVDIPLPYLEALLLYVAGRLLTGSGNLTGANDGSIMMAKYNQAIQRVSEQGYYIQDTSTNLKKETNGWV